MLGNGELLEFDAPDVLLSDNESQFSSLVEQTGAAEAAHLRELANKAAEAIKSNDQNLADDPDNNFDSEIGEKDPLIV